MGNIIGPKKGKVAEKAWQKSSGQFTLRNRMAGKSSQMTFDFKEDQAHRRSPDADIRATRWAIKRQMQSNRMQHHRNVIRNDPNFFDQKPTNKSRTAGARPVDPAKVAQKSDLAKRAQKKLKKRFPVLRLLDAIRQVNRTMTGTKK